MTREKLPELISKEEVNRLREQAARRIRPFLESFVRDLLCNKINLEVDENDEGERKFSTKFRGHNVWLRTCGARPGFPVGGSVYIFIDGVLVDAVAPPGFCTAINRYLDEKYSDVVTLKDAINLQALSSLLSE